MLSTDQKGSIAETAVAPSAIKLGIDVYKPLVDGTRADLVFDLGANLARVPVQVGSTSRRCRGRAVLLDAPNCR